MGMVFIMEVWQAIITAAGTCAATLIVTYVFNWLTNGPKKRKEEAEKREQQQKQERIRKAYINGSFTIKEYDEEKEIVDKTITSIETKIRNCEVCNELKFTPEDILIKRDIDYINKIVYPKEYEENTYMWEDYSRKEKE